jgi:hypothetical protein
VGVGGRAGSHCDRDKELGMESGDALEGDRRSEIVCMQWIFFPYVYSYCCYYST